MGHKFEEMKKDASYDDICSAKKDLLDVFLGEIHTKGATSMDTMEAGQVVDMIKDLAEAEKACMEACYYETVIHTMNEYSEDDENDRMGYNNRRYASGRYAPKGKGSVSGYYRPYENDEVNYRYPYVRDPEMMRMGYTERDWDSSDSNRDPRYGKAFNEYKTAKRHYTETKSSTDKERMERMATEHMNDTMTTIRDIWKEADPTLRKKMKADLTTLVNEMTV